MSFISHLYELFYHDYFFFQWRDAAEILFFSTIFFYIARWLKKDTQKNLLPHFYSYCLLAFAAYILDLNTVTAFLFLCWPVCAMILMFMHQQTLQRNLIAIKNISNPATHSHDWLAALIRACLVHINNNKTVYCIIEHTDSMKDFIQNPMLISAQVNDELLSLLLESPTYNQQKMMWVRTNGQLIGINGTWKQPHSLDNDTTTWHHETLLYTAKTDALAFCCDPISRNFTVIVANKIFNNVSSYHALNIIKKQYNMLTTNQSQSTHPTNQTGVKHAIQKNNNQKHTS